MKSIDIKKILTGFGVFVLLFLVSQIPGTVLSGLMIVMMDAKMSFDPLAQALFIAITVASCALAIFLATRFKVVDEVHPRNLRGRLHFLLIGWVGLFCASFVGSLFLNGAETANQEVLNQLTRMMPTIIMFTTAAIGAPVMEELAFRGAIMNRMLGDYPVLAIIISTFFFAMAHGPTDFGSFLTYGSMGLVLALLYHHTKRIEVTIGAHFLWNGFGVLLGALIGG
jgi:membrane protease YdiL (CAAX protease family)